MIVPTVLSSKLYRIFLPFLYRQNYDIGPLLIYWGDDAALSDFHDDVTNSAADEDYAEEGGFRGIFLVAGGNRIRGRSPRVSIVTTINIAYCPYLCPILY